MEIPHIFSLHFHIFTLRYFPLFFGSVDQKLSAPKKIHGNAAYIFTSFGYFNFSMLNYSIILDFTFSHLLDFLNFRCLNYYIIEFYIFTSYGFLKFSMFELFYYWILHFHIFWIFDLLVFGFLYFPFYVSFSGKF